MARSNTQKTRHWAQQRERGSLLLMRLTVWLVGKLGRRNMTPIVGAVVLYFYLFSPKARSCIASYQQRLNTHSQRSNLFPSTAPVYRHFLAFAQAILDKIDVWQDRILLAHLDIDDPHNLHSEMGARPGQMLLGAHLGNLEICRALAQKHTALVLNVLIHSKHAESFNRLLISSGANNVRLVQVSELDAATMLDLNRRIAQGEWIALTGDRVALSGARTVSLDFLGAKAHFPQGAWLLASLLRCPVNSLICTRHGQRFHLSMQRICDEVVLDRNQRAAGVTRYAQQYADVLALACQQAPLQWFNFFDFWGDHDK